MREIEDIEVMTLKEFMDMEIEYYYCDICGSRYIMRYEPGTSNYNKIRCTGKIPDPETSEKTEECYGGLIEPLTKQELIYIGERFIEGGFDEQIKEMKVEDKDVRD